MKNIPAAVVARYAILRFAKIKTQAHFDQIDAELDRELPAVLNGDGTRSRNWDESRSYLNRDLLDTPLDEQTKSTYTRVLERIGNQKIRKNAVLGVEMFMGFSPGMQGHIDVDEWANSQIAWVRKTFGADALLKAVLHLDEATPHIQVIIVPFCGKTKSGLRKLNCRGLMGDRGDKKAGRPGQLETLQDSYAAHNKQFGLERGLKSAAIEHIPLKQIRREDRRASEFASKLQQALEAPPLMPQVSWSITDTPNKWMAKQKKVIEDALAHKQREIDEAGRQLLRFAQTTLKHWQVQRQLNASEKAVEEGKSDIDLMATHLNQRICDKEKERSTLALKVAEQQAVIEGLRRIIAEQASAGTPLTLHRSRGLQRQPPPPPL
jgi:hypothetical protein